MKNAYLTDCEHAYVCLLALRSLPHAQKLSALYGDFLDHLDDLVDDLRTRHPADLIAPPKPLRSRCGCR